MVQTIAPHLYRIPVQLPRNPLRELNSYLIQDGDNSLLIDTGFRMDECRAGLLAGLAELGQDPARLDILLTHLHSDHAGLAPDLIGPGRTIYIGAVDRPGVEDGDAARAFWDAMAEEFLAAGTPPALLRDMMAANPAVAGAPRYGCTQYASLQDGDVLRRGGYTLRCLHTPGHTPGHLCLWDEEHKRMFTGDHVLFDITPNITNWLGVPDALGDYLASLRRVRTFAVETALPAHRGTGDFHQRVDALLAHHEGRLDEAASILCRTPGSTIYDIAGQMTWSIRAKSWAEFPPAQKIFAVGECRAHLDHLEARGRVQKETDPEGIWHYTAL